MPAPSASGPGVVDGLGITAVSTGEGLEGLGSDNGDDGTSVEVVGLMKIDSEDVVSVAVSRGGELNEGCTELDSVVASSGGPNEGCIVFSVLKVLVLSWSSVESPAAVVLSSAELDTGEGSGFVPAVA